MEFFGKTNIDFLSKRKYFFYLSSAINILGITVALVFGVRMGIDFAGGTEVGVRFSSEVHTDKVREAVSKAGFHNAEIKSYGKPNEFLIRVKEVSAADAKETPASLIKAGLVTAFPHETIVTLKEDKIGPKIGKELTGKAALAVGLAIIAIMLYIAFRFELIFGLGAVISLLHDVIVAFTFVVVGQQFNILNLEFNQGMLAALLTVVGFSINDTVIIFDRIRENRDRHKGLAFIDLLNLSMNEVLSRTINTVLTVVLVLATILAFGGEALQGFSFTMLIGIITGTYSSIYVASAFIVWFMELQDKKGGTTTGRRHGKLAKA